jgi:flagellar hook assembly protein FlgD
LPGGAGATEEGWSQFGFDSGNTGYHPDCEEPLARQGYGRDASLSVRRADEAGSQQIQFYLPADEKEVELTVYDAQGRRVRVLANGPRATGLHEAIWNGRDDKGRPSPSGVYFYRLTRDSGEAIVRKAVYLR